MERLGVSERRACKTIGLSRSTKRYKSSESGFVKRLTERMIALAREYGRYGYRQMTGMLNLEGWRINHKRIERLWRQEGLKAPKKQPKKGRLW